MRVSTSFAGVPNDMKGARQIITVGCTVAACASPGSGARADAGQLPGGVAPNIYEVAAEQVPPEQQAAPFIEVTGNGSVDVTPDQAQISLAMETRAESASAAADANAEAMQEVLSALRAGSFPGLDLDTYGYSVQPEYAMDNQRVRTISGYVARNNVRATIDDVEAVGRLIDTAIGAGANRVANIGFTASDPEPARAQALAEAVTNARAQAQTIAESLGYELGAPLEIHGGAQRPIPVMYDAMRTVQAAAAPTPIETSDQTITANVTIRFALGRELSRR